MANGISNWEKFEVIIQLLILVFAIVAVFFSVIASNTANNIALQSLEISNYKTTFAPYIAEGDLGIHNYTGSESPFLSAYGNITLSLIVTTPHAYTLNISNPATVTSFTLTNYTLVGGDGRTRYPVLDQNKLQNTLLLVGPLAEPVTSMDDFNYPKVHAPFFQQYTAFVQSGVNQVNFTIPIYGSFQLNPNAFKQSGQAVPFGMNFDIMDFTIKMTVIDMQTQKADVLTFTGPVYIRLWANPPF